MNTMFKKQGKTAFVMSFTTVQPHQHFRNGTWQQDSSDIRIGMWLHNQQAMNYQHNGEQKFQSNAFLSRSHDPDSYQKNDWKHAVI